MITIRTGIVAKLKNRVCDWGPWIINTKTYLSANDFANLIRSAHLAVDAKPADRWPYTSMESAPSEQCSENSSDTGITNCRVWLKLNMATSVVWPSFKMSLLLSFSGSVGGTTVGSCSPQKWYWQNTKWDKDGGNPAAFLTVTWTVIVGLEAASSLSDPSEESWANDPETLCIWIWRRPATSPLVNDRYGKNYYWPNTEYLAEYLPIIWPKLAYTWSRLLPI